MPIFTVESTSLKMQNINDGNENYDINKCHDIEA